jgi:hypothetical protein
VFKTILEGTQAVVLSANQIEADSKYTQSPEAFSFSVCQPENSEGRIINPNPFATCRESLQTMLENEIMGVNTAHKIPMDKGRFLLKLRSEKEDCLAKAIQLVHLYEQEYDFPQTLCFKTQYYTPEDVVRVTKEKGLTTKIYDTKLRFYYLIATRKWIKSSYMASLYFLILRAVYQCGGTIDDAAFESLDAWRKYVNSARAANFLAHSYVKDTYKYWELVLKNYHELFGKFRIDNNWSYNFNEMRDEKTMRYEGVYRLIGSTQSARMRKRWERIKNKKGEERKAS